MKRRRLLPPTLCMTALCLWSAGASAQGSDLESASNDDKARASAHYTQGMASFQAGDARAALEQFERSYEAVRSPNSHLMMGKALIDLGRYADAHRELAETIEEAERAESLDPKYAQTRQAAEEELARVENQVVKLEISVSPDASDARVRVNDREYTRDELAQPLVLEPGSLEVILLQAGEPVAQKRLEGRAGQSLSVALAPAASSTSEDERPTSASDETLPAEKQPFPHRRETAYVAGGLGVAGALTFGIFGLLNNAKYSDAEDECQNDVCSSDLRADAERGHDYQVIANVGLVVGVVGLGTALALILTEDDDPQARRNATRVSLGPGQLSVRGSF